MAYEILSFKPMLDINSAYSAGDVLFHQGNTAFGKSSAGVAGKIGAIRLPNRKPAKLESIRMNYLINSLSADPEFSLYALVNPQTTEGSSFGAENATASGTVDLFASEIVNSTSTVFTQFVKAFVAADFGARDGSQHDLVCHSIDGSFDPLILQPDEDGFVYFMAIASAAVTAVTNCQVDMAAGVVVGTTQTIIFDAGDPEEDFSPGDLVVDATNNVIGTVESVTATTIKLTTTALHAAADDEVLHNGTPLHFHIGVSY
jgi:hypothetical protein